MKSEESLHNSVCKYLDLQYNDIIYTSDLSGIRLPIGLAKKAKAIRCKKYKIPDLIIFAPRGSYCGLIIELKTNIGEVFGKKGQVLSKEHIQEQILSLYKLNAEGYFATFSFGFNQTVALIDTYMKDKQPYLIIDKL